VLPQEEARVSLKKERLFSSLFKPVRSRYQPITQSFSLEEVINIHYQQAMLNPSPTGTVFAIKRYSLHDGPDLRVTAFFKGCPLSCLWCHNPEGMGFNTEIHTTAARCVGCGECLRTCPDGALSLEGTALVRNVDLCTACGACAETCPALAHEATGACWTVEQVLAEIAKDAPFFEGTKGGVTFSGGEPLAQPGFLAALLRECGRRGWHRAVDTSGFASWDTLRDIQPHTDLFLFDLKHMDTQKHRRATGVDNALILDNARRLAGLGATIQFRLPLIPGLNDDDGNIRGTGLFAASLPGVQGIDVLPYHATARAKYAKLDRTYPGDGIPPSDPDQVDRAVKLLQDCGLTVRIGG
jgi:pyruvate formate lyase activating enzyme